MQALMRCSLTELHTERRKTARVAIQLENADTPIVNSTEALKKQYKFTLFSLIFCRSVDYNFDDTYPGTLALVYIAGHFLSIMNRRVE